MPVPRSYWSAECLGLNRRDSKPAVGSAAD